MELMSPASNLESAYAAFLGGADAIYLGGKNFSARARAENFTNEEIEEITSFAHSINKKVYVALNILLFQDEFFLAVEFAKFLYRINIDGIIIQDLGLAYYLHQILPDLPLNASTQLNCHNLRQAEALKKIGFKRIVLAREVSLENAKKIKSLGVEVELFIQGALCVSYSGNCLMSSFIGDRSGNRGRCAQPCRMNYTLLEDDSPLEYGFELSTKDLCTISYINKFKEANIDSLKIEGRLKSKEYIYIVSKTYRHALDAIKEKKENKELQNDLLDLKKIFNRDFTKGFIFNESPFNLLNKKSSSHQGEIIGKVIKINKKRITIKLNKKLHRLDGIRFNNKEQIGLIVEKMFKKGNPIEEAFINDEIEIVNVENASKLENAEVIKTKDYLLNKKIENELKNKIKIPIKATFYAYPNNVISLSLMLNKNKITVNGEKALPSIKNGTDKNRILEQLNKSGDYPYYINEIDFKMNDCFIPISALNDLKNKAYKALKDSFNKNKEVKEEKYISDFKIKNSETLNAIYEDEKQIIKDNQINFHFTNNSLTNKNYLRIENQNDFNIAKALLHFPIIKKDENYLIASFYTNVTNSYALDAFYSLGFNEVILSTELDDKSIKLLIDDFYFRHKFKANVGLLIYGKIDFMIMKSCPIGTYYQNAKPFCLRCHEHKYELKDRINEYYRLIGDKNCNLRLLSNRSLYLLDKINYIKELGVTNLYLLFTFENKLEIENIIKGIKEEKNDFNRFSFYRGHFFSRSL